MGLIYSSADSSELMSALASNLSVARTTTSELTAGCQQLIAAIDGHTLSGAAYNAGKGLFSELVIPTIHRMTAAVDNVQSDLAKYSAADAFIASEGFLDEDKLKLKIKIMKANQQLLHDSARAVATLAHSQPIPGIYELLQNAQRTFIKMAESMQQDIDKLHKQIQKLNEFDRQTKNLFATSLEEMELAMQGILILNETTVKSNGLYTLPSGVDKSYFTEIKKAETAEMKDKQLLKDCTILYIHDKSRNFEYYMLEKDGYIYQIDKNELTGSLASLVKKYDLDVLKLTPKELTTRANNQQKKGYNYFEKDDRVFGLGLLSKGQGVMDEIQESGVWDSLWMLGMGVASVRNAQTFSKKVSGLGKNIENVNPSEIRFSQTSVNGSDKIIASMKANGWKGDTIDVVRMPDGSMTTLDNTRVAAAREVKIDVQANVRSYDTPLPNQATIDRFTTKKGVPKTWGEAVELRVGKQKADFKNNNPMGSFDLEKMK